MLVVRVASSVAGNRVAIGAVPEVKTKPAGRTFKSEYIAAIVPIYAENEFDAKNILKHSNLPSDPTKEQIINWAKAYRAGRDGGLSVADAATKANG